MTDPTGIDPRRETALWEDAARRDTAQTDHRTTVSGAQDPHGDEVSRFATHGDPTLAGDDAQAERAGVQWVRPTDLAARAGGTVVEQGAKWNTLLHDAALDGIREGRVQLRERLAHRQEELEPVTTTPGRALQPVAGRTGVSR